MTIAAQPTESTERYIPKIGLSREEAAWSAGVSLATINRWMSQGILEHSKIGGKVVIEPDVLAEMIRGQRTRRNAR